MFTSLLQLGAGRGGGPGGSVAPLSARFFRPMQPATPSDLAVHLLDVTANDIRMNLTFNLIFKRGSVSHVTYEPSQGIRTG